MKTKIKCLLPLLLLLPVGCSKDSAGLRDAEDITTGEALSHGMMVLGRQLEDPYSLRNMTKALEAVSPTKASVTQLTPTDMYVRFLPRDEEEFARLQEQGIDLLDHPLDYQILKEGDYWHDPSLDEDAITWQYAVLPHGSDLPEDIVYEILDDCFIPENAATKADGIDWEAVEREAFRLTGNADLLEPRTKAQASQPSGRITIVDPHANEVKAFGLAVVKVVCNVFVKFSATYTDRDGYYTIPKRFSSAPRYRLMFQNRQGFNIGLNLNLLPASLSTLGKGPSDGIDAVITPESDRLLFCRAAVSNAAYDYYSRCAEDDLAIATPPASLRIWIFQHILSSSTPMLHHGTLVDKTLIGKYLGDYAPLLALFLPDVTIGAKEKNTYAALYAETVHELSHASHYAQAGKDYWDNYILYILSAFLDGGNEDYGTGTGEYAGYCEIGEMWGYFMQNTLMNDRYGGAMPTSGMHYWFHPQIFRYLYERGFTRSQLFRALQPDVCSRDALQGKLLKLYPEKEAIISQVFARYAE